LEEQNKILTSELERLKESVGKDSATINELRSRDQIYKLIELHNSSTSKESPNYDTLLDDQEKKLKSIENQILRLAVLQKDIDLKEQNIKKSRERFLEKLQSSVPNDKTILESANLQVKREMELLQLKLEEQSRLLNESDSTSGLLLIQTKTLKEEIRNYERLIKREDNCTKNTEYLKNIILKFIQTNNEQLIPVLGNLLQFSPEEYLLIRNAAKPMSPSLLRNSADYISSVVSLRRQSSSVFQTIKQQGFWF